MIQKIKLTILLVAVTGVGSVYGQVTVGADVEPAKAALLEVKSQAADASTNVTSTTGGLGLPRVSLVSATTMQPFIVSATADEKTAHTGLMVYNLNTTAPFSAGIYVWDGAKWIQVGAGSGDANPEKYFYIPSHNIPLDEPGTTERTFDLYAEYARQFTKDANNTTFVTSNDLLTKVPSKATGTLYEADQLDYVVTYYDTNIISDVSVTDAGILKYKVVSRDTSPASFLNVVFVVK